MLPLLRGCSSTGKMVNPSRDGGLPWTMSQTCARHAHTPLDVSFCYTLASRRIFCYFSFLSSLCYGPWWSDINEWMNDWMMDELIDWLISCDWVDWTARCDAGQKWTDRHTATEADGYLDPNSVVVSGIIKHFQAIWTDSRSEEYRNLQTLCEKLLSVYTGAPLVQQSHEACQVSSSCTCQLSTNTMIQ